MLVKKTVIMFVIVILFLEGMVYAVENGQGLGPVQDEYTVEYLEELLSKEDSEKAKKKDEQKDKQEAQKETQEKTANNDQMSSAKNEQAGSAKSANEQQTPEIKVKEGDNKVRSDAAKDEDAGETPKAAEGNLPAGNLYQDIKMVNIAMTVIPQEGNTRKFENLNKHGDLVALLASDFSSAKTGTGFFVTPEVIVTNWHVVSDAKTVLVNLVSDAGLYEYPVQAIVIAADPLNDLALISPIGKYTSRRVSPLPLADISKVYAGEIIYTMGFPMPEQMGFRPKITNGIINGVAGMNDDPRCYQINTPIQPGSSGSPVVNSYGQVIGVVMGTLSGKAMRGVNYQNVNYAIKSNLVQNLLLSLPDGLLAAEKANFRKKIEGEDIMFYMKDAVCRIEVQR